MIKQKKILIHTFCSTFAVITIVLAMAIAFLYITMPSYYLNEKREKLESNAELLDVSLKLADSEDACAQLISTFVHENNAFITSFDKNGNPLLMLSSPFVGVVNEKNILYLSTDSTDDIEDKKTAVRLQTEGELNPGLNQGATVIIEKQETEPTDGTKTSNKIIVSDDQPFGRTVQIKWAAGKSSNVVSAFVDIQNEYIERIAVSSPLQPINEAQEVILSLLPYLLGIGIASALVFSLLFSRKITKPILAISSATVSMHNFERGVKSNIRTDDELGELSKNLDEMYDHLCTNMQQLKLETEKATKLERYKTEFLQSTGHELKTPLAALNGIVEGMMDNVGVYKDRDRYLFECKGLIAKLSHLVNDILMASSSDISESIQVERILLKNAIEAALEQQIELIGSKNLKVIKNELSEFITADERAFAKALFCVIDNAVKYASKDGEIHIFSRETAGRTELCVDNQCDNIPQDELEKIFEPFYTRSYSRDKSVSGTGLGLYIAKKNLEKMGAGICVENTENGVRTIIMI